VLNRIDFFGGLLISTVLAFSFIIINHPEFGPAVGASTFSTRSQGVSQAIAAPLISQPDQWQNTIGTFSRKISQDQYSVTYTWTDYIAEKRTITLDFSKEVLMNSINQFGLSADTRKKFYQENLPGFLEQYQEMKVIISRIKMKKGPVHFRDHNSANPNLYEEFSQKITWFEQKYLDSQGFHIFNQGRVTIDYSAVVIDHAPLLKEATVKFLNHAIEKEMSWQMLAYTIMSFVQYINYQLPPVREANRYIGGLWSPVETLVNGAGDCDTKAVLFSAMLKNYSQFETIIVVIPGHAFNGIKGWHKRFPRDHVLKLHGQDVLMLDLTSDSNYDLAGGVHELDKQNLRNQFPIVYEM